MTIITIRNIDEDLRLRLQSVAETNGCSIEKQARRILNAALPEKKLPDQHLTGSIQQRFAFIDNNEVSPSASQRHA